MVRFGLTPLQAIQAVMINAADLLGRADLLGTLEWQGSGSDCRRSLIRLRTSAFWNTSSS